MKPSDLTTLTANLKGCALAVFFVMLIIRRVTSPKELALLASYNEKTVRESLHKLRHLGLVTTTGNERWMLTDQGYQLPFPAEPDYKGTNQLAEEAASVPNFGHDVPKKSGQSRKREKISGLGTDHPPTSPIGRNGKPKEEETSLIVPKPEKKSQVLHRSSSYISITTDSELHDLKTTTTDEKGEKISGFDITALGEPAISLLTDRWACPKSQATAVVTEALNLAHLKGMNLELAALVLQWEILLWLAWYFSPHGKGIHAMPAFIVAKLKNFELPPDWFVPDQQHELYQEILAIEKQISDKEQEHEIQA